MTDVRYTFEEVDAMCDYQEAVNKLRQLEEELSLYDYTDSRRYEIDCQIDQLEAWVEDLLAGIGK